jgi:threonine/homoserine efflux transporter RhtA
MAQNKSLIVGLITIAVVVDGLQFAGISGRLLLEVAAIVAVIGAAMLFVIFIISDIRNADKGRSFSGVIIAFLSAIIMSVILI